MRRDRVLTLILGLALTYLAGHALAGKGGGNGGGGKPPNDGPPPDPAIAFFEDGDVGELVVINEDGSNRTVLLAAGRKFGRPAWSPDGAQLAFKCDIQGPGIYVINVDGTGLRKVISTNGTGADWVDWSPVAAPDGDFKIAFSDVLDPSDPIGLRDIFLVNLDGTGLLNLTNTPGHSEQAPCWSPDADRLVVETVPYPEVRDGDPAVWDVAILDLALVNDTLAVADSLNLTSDPDVPGGPLNASKVIHPTWARTRNAIVVSTLRNGDYDAWVIDLASPATPLALTDESDGVEAMYPAFSADDSEVAFFSADLKPAGIYVIATDGSAGFALIYSFKQRWAAAVPALRR